MEIRLTRPGAQGRQFLRFTDTKFDDLGEATFTQTGFVEVDPNKSQEVLQAYIKGERKKVFGRFNRQTGLYDLETAYPDGTTESQRVEGPVVTQENTVIKNRG